MHKTRTFVNLYTTNKQQANKWWEKRKVFLKEEIRLINAEGMKADEVTKNHPFVIIRKESLIKARSSEYKFDKEQDSF